MQHTDEQEPSDQGHDTRNTTHRADTQVDRCQVAKNTAHTAHRTWTTVDRSQLSKDTADAA